MGYGADAIKHFNDICNELEDSEKGVRSICSARVNISYSTFKEILKSEPLLATQYARAKESQCEYWTEQLMSKTIELSDRVQRGDIDVDFVSASVQALRLEVDTIKWLLSKLMPKKYGDKLELSGDADNPIKTQNEHRFIVEDMRDGTETEI